MRAFARLYQQLDETTKTHEKISAMVDYFAKASSADAAYAIYFLLGNKLKPSFPSRFLRLSGARSASIPDWLFEETYQWVGDLAETAAAVAVGKTEATETSLHQSIELELLPLLKHANRKKGARRKRIDSTEVVSSSEENTEEDIYTRLISIWSRQDRAERLVCNKLLTGNLRVGVSAKLVTRALSEWSGLPADRIALRLMGDWDPTAKFFAQLVAPEDSLATSSRPYPFCLAHPLPDPPVSLGDADLYSVEWKWDGIRSQLVRRGGEVFLWSRGDELLAGRFPEIEQAAARLDNGIVLDGEILAWVDRSPLPFTQLQRRIQRKRVPQKILDEIPVVFIAFDILECEGRDLRSHSFSERRSILDGFEFPEPIRRAETLRCNRWDDIEVLRQKARQGGAEGVMLKQLASRYESGRVTGAWWKWKVSPYTVDAVLTYAQRGHGRRAGLFSDYTFGVWDKDRLVTFAKAYSGLTNEELERIDRWIREHTTNRFGPVHEVEPKLVMELAFENIQVSTRHKSGIAVRFPRIMRIREDKQPHEADRLESIRAMIQSETPRDSPRVP